MISTAVVVIQVFSFKIMLTTIMCISMSFFRMLKSLQVFTGNSAYCYSYTLLDQRNVGGYERLEGFLEKPKRTAS